MAVCVSVYVTVSLQQGPASQTDVNGLICNPVYELCYCVGGSGVICQLPQAKHAQGNLLTLPQTHTQRYTHRHMHTHLHLDICTRVDTQRQALSGSANIYPAVSRQTANPISH